MFTLAFSLVVAGAGGNTYAPEFDTGRTCTINALFTSCNISVTFSPSFASVPRFRPTLQKVSPSSPKGLASFNIFPNVPLVFVTGPQTWTDMDSFDSPSEIFDATNNRLQTFLGISSLNVNWNFCVTVITPSLNSSATLGVQTSLTQTGPWNDFGSSALRVNVGTAPSNGISCVSETFQAPTAFENFRIVGRDGFGVGDAPSFGTISLYIAFLSSSIAVPNPIWLHYTGLTASGVTINAISVLGQVVSETVTVDWSAFP
jgi:hypothetical protein